MGMTPLASPVDIARGALADQLAQRELGQRPEMRVGEMREREHTPALAFNARATSSMTAAAGEDDAACEGSVGRAHQLRDDARVGQGDSRLPDEARLGVQAGSDEGKKHDDFPSGNGVSL